MRHYQFAGEHLQGLKGYEYYAQMAKMRAAMPENIDTAGIYLLASSNTSWGSPKTCCLEKLQRVNDMMGADEFAWRCSPMLDAPRRGREEHAPLRREGAAGDAGLRASRSAAGSDELKAPVPG